MRRRDFIGTAVAAVVSGASPASAACGASQAGFQPCVFQALPNRIAGMSLEELRDEYRDRLFHRYLPFWDRGGFDQDPRLEALLLEHVERIMNGFWNPDFGIANEYLAHDYSRLPEAAPHMFAGHALETLWIVMHEALRINDQALFTTAKDRIRRLLEMCWDYVFEGWGDGNFFVHDTPEHHRGPEYEIKTMWAHCEILIASMSILEYTGEVWAKEWYERARAFALKTMANTGHGVWRQAVDRFGKDVKRVGVGSHRKDNFHPPRMLMMNLLSLQRMIANAGKLTPFPQ